MVTFYSENRDSTKPKKETKTKTSTIKNDSFTENYIRVDKMLNILKNLLYVISITSATTLSVFSASFLDWYRLHTVELSGYLEVNRNQALLLGLKEMNLDSNAPTDENETNLKMKLDSLLHNHTGYLIFSFYKNNENYKSNNKYIEESIKYSVIVEKGHFSKTINLPKDHRFLSYEFHHPFFSITNLKEKENTYKDYLDSNVIYEKIVVTLKNL